MLFRSIIRTEDIEGNPVGSTISQPARSTEGLPGDMRHIYLPVSYTHLDVYKRQIQNKEIAKEAAQEVWYEIIKSIDSFNGESGLSTWIYTLCKRTIPVSYTHLDVYKRQETVWPIAFVYRFQ